jgi:hypothetical protein
VFAHDCEPRMSTPRPVVEPPPAGDLLLLVADFLEQELAPSQTDAKLRYRTRVAANLLRVARRELDRLNRFEIDREGYAVPSELLARGASLSAFAAALEEGREELTDPEIFALVLRYVEEKLAIAAPKALGG